ncbi:MAG: hypothetical protein IJL69_05010, partial [Oscillospiraceae bacterium]|nr:hypothetical protein [Oscillospiraceae bacterium]
MKKIWMRWTAALLAAWMIGAMAFGAAATGTLISVDPRDASFTVGETPPTLTVAAAPSQGGELSCQWYDGSGAAVAGATGLSFTPKITDGGTYSYYAVVTETVDGAAVATDSSRTATVTATRNAETPTITESPASASCTVGQTVTLKAAAKVSQGTLSYRWYCYTAESAVGGVTEIYTANGPTYTPPTDRASSVYYFCRVTNTDNTANGEKKASANSGTALVTVRNTGDAEAPLVFAQPQPQSVEVGGTASFSVGASVSDGGTLSWQWYRCADETGAAGEPMEGEDTATFVPDTSAEAEYWVYCVLTNRNDGVTGERTAEVRSDVVRLSVRRPDVPGAVWDGRPVDDFAGGTGGGNDPFVIRTGGQLALFAGRVNEGTADGLWFVLDEDVILNDETSKNLWTPAGNAGSPFTGHFDGRGHRITGLLTAADGELGGLFGLTSEAEIRNVQVEGRASGRTAGGIAAVTVDSVVENCLFSGTVSAGTAGGIVGSACGGAVANCLSLGLPAAGETAGYALTESSFRTAEALALLSRRAAAKAGLAAWGEDETGAPRLEPKLTEESALWGELAPQSGASGTNAIAQTSLYGEESGGGRSLWVDPAELAQLVRGLSVLMEEEDRVPYVFLDGAAALA